MARPGREHDIPRRKKRGFQRVVDRAIFFVCAPKGARRSFPRNSRFSSMSSLPERRGIPIDDQLASVPTFAGPVRTDIAAHSTIRPPLYSSAPPPQKCSPTGLREALRAGADHKAGGVAEGRKRIAIVLRGRPPDITRILSGFVFFPASIASQCIQC
jgi:hypothetical protein